MDSKHTYFREIQILIYILKKIQHIDVNRINKVGKGNNGTFNKKT